MEFRSVLQKFKKNDTIGSLDQFLKLKIFLSFFTHCKTGAIIAIGLMREGRKGVDLKLAGKIFVGWVVTLPVAAAISAALYKVLELVLV